jgi:hypothetical protein
MSKHVNLTIFAVAPTVEFLLRTPTGLPLMSTVILFIVALPTPNEIAG